MNASIRDAQHASIIYYDSDYPSKDFPVYPENFDATVIEQGIDEDVNVYKHLTDVHGKHVLELCCGTGRVTIPLVLHGCNVTAVDVSNALLKRLKNKVELIEDFPTDHLNIVKQDVTNLALSTTDFDVALCAFNGLLCITDFSLQQKTLQLAADHLKSHGILVLDVWNPLVLDLHGDHVPTFYFTRKRVDNGNSYSRYAATGAMNADQVQSLYGWYDETLPSGETKRTTYDMSWRLIFRYEIELMLEKAGLKIINLYGGNKFEPLETTSMKMFIVAEKK